MLAACVAPPAGSTMTGPGDGKGDNPSAVTDNGNGTKTVTLRTLAWTFDVSTYAVSVSGCTHQGLGSRLTIRDQVDVKYKQEQRSGRYYLTELSRMPKAGTTTSTLNQWYDHGRTVNYSNGCQDVLTEVTFVEILKDSIASASEDVVQNRAIEDKVGACIKTIPDGPCDSMGSCNYCLPSELNVVSCTGGIDDTNGGVAPVKPDNLAS